jgi:beta-glucosidase
MTPFDTEFGDLLLELVREGSIPESRIDTSVRRVLRIKEQLGLFERKPIHLDDFPDFGSAAAQQLSKTAADASLVLLKNDNQILPLPSEANILVCGPAADKQRVLNGGWTVDWQGLDADEALKDFPTIRQAIEQTCTGTVTYREALTFHQETDFREAIWKAQEADYVILCLGEDSYCEDEGNIQDLYLDERQTNLALALAETGTPVVLILAEGRPRLISRFADNIPAIVGAFYPGPQGGRALADLIFGKTNPAGRLPFTYPRHPNALLNYDHKYSEDRVLERSGASYLPQFPFGHGLSYTNFSYRHLKTDRKQYRAEESIQIQVKVKNEGDRAGQETVLVFISDLYASITPPVKRLRVFEKVYLQAREEKTLRFGIQPSQLAFVGINNQWTLEPGTFRIRIGDLEQDFELIT